MPEILRLSRDDPRSTTHRHPMSEYPGMPGILRLSRDDPRSTTHIDTLYLTILESRDIHVHTVQDDPRLDTIILYCNVL